MHTGSPSHGQEFFQVRNLIVQVFLVVLPWTYYKVHVDWLHQT